MPLGVPCSHLGYIGERIMAIRADGTLWSWGNANQFEWRAVIGDGTEESRQNPVQIMENVRTVVPTQNGGRAITNDNVLWQWRGASWVFDEESMESIAIPAMLTPTPIMENVATVSGNRAITIDGELFSLPLIGEPERLMSNVIYAISNGGSYFAITADNVLYAWGRNRLPHQWRSGPNLGDGTTIDRETPVRIMENAASITIVGNTAYVIKTDSTLWGWGNVGGWDGQILLGDGSQFAMIEGYAWEDMFENAYDYSNGHYFPSGFRWLLPDCGGSGIRLSPVKILENVVQVDATYTAFDHGWVRSFRAFAVTENGELWAWGANDDNNRGFSLLGDGTSEPRAYPVRIIEGDLLIPPRSRFPAPLRFVPPTVEISEAGRMAAVEFLRDFYSLYSFGDTFNGPYHCRIEGGILTERPLVLYHWESITDTRFYDRNGELFEDVVFLREFGVVAEGFVLYDIIGDGIPTIFIFWGVPETCMTFIEIFIFDGQEYVSMGSISQGWQLFYNYDGRLVLLYDAGLYDYYAYYFLTHDDEGLEVEIFLRVERVGRDCANFAEWDAHHRGDDFAENPTIFRTNLPLTPIPPLTDLRDEIIAYLRASYR